jgi:DNA sulfur modification protein DndE
MKWNRLRFSQEASEALGRLKGRTGLTPNILARIGFMLSIEDPIEPDPQQYDSSSNREIDRKVLTGEWDDLFIALILERMAEDPEKQQDAFQYFRAHMNRGIMLLHKRVKGLGDIARIIGNTAGNQNEE